MFDRFIRLAQAKKALREGRLEEAARLAADPLIAADRRAEEVRVEVLARLHERGRTRLQAGDAEAAARELTRAIAAGGDSAVRRDLEEANQQVRSAAERGREIEARLEDARKQAGRGHLRAAEQVLADLPEDSGHGATLRQVRTFLAGRRGEAERLLADARASLEADRASEAVELLRAARACDEGCADERFVRRVASAAAPELAAAIRGATSRSALADGLAVLRARVAALPELARESAVVEAGDGLAKAIAQVLEAGRAASTIELLQACAAGGLAVMPEPSEAWSRLQAIVPLLLRLPTLRASGQATELETALRELASLLPAGPFAAEADELAKKLRSAEERLSRARRHAADGELDRARAELGCVLELLPMHEEARTEREALDRSEREREQRLQAARDAVRAGRLREAYAIVLADSGRGPVGTAAAQLAGELRSRMDLVTRGLDEVRAVLHGRTSSSVASLRHCQLRLEELEKLQCDHEELVQLRRGLAVEIELAESLDAAFTALDAGRIPPVAVALERLVATRGRLPGSDRLDARALQLVDRLGQMAERAALGGRLEEAEACANTMALVGVMAATAAEHVERIRATCQERRAAAAAKAAEAAAALERRDLRAAESACDAARQLWVDGGAPAKLEAELVRLRDQEAELTRIEECQKAGDLSSARVAMDSLPPTPPMLRTRIFDMKRSLMQAQGLEGAFLLRVDEGGEFVVLRGDSISIGNLRDGTSDLPVLAAIAGRHARIQRSMSFHGGMQDSLVAEGGEMRVGGEKVSRHVLRNGDRFQLGASLQFGYHLPCRRSLTAMLQVHGGFQVAGTDRVLLLKDRGRDGRICLGPGADVHVRVAGATAEVELYGTKTGQMRVRCQSGGDIDGRPFQDEHPVDAGAVVRAGGLSFVLLPWAARR